MNPPTDNTPRRFPHLDEPVSTERALSEAAGLHKQGRLTEAEDIYREILTTDPEDARVLSLLGFALKDQGKPEDAVPFLSRALDLSPADATGHYNLANTLHDLGRFNDAIQSYQSAIETKLDFHQARMNLGAALTHHHRPDDAVRTYDEALELSPGDAEALTSRALAHLLAGNFETGWRDYENRFDTDAHRPNRRNFTQPRWDGEDLDGRTVLLTAEQGFGDTLQFVRYAAAVIEKDGRVVLECQPALVRLLAGMDGIDGVIARGDALPDFDVHCPLMSLPYTLGTSPDTIPADVPYISADDDQVKNWQARLAEGGEPENGDGLKIGLCWAPRPAETGHGATVAGARRNIALKLFAPLAGVEGVRLFSLQLGDAAAETGDPGLGFEITDLTGDIDDFADTAGLVANLDLVISVDTSIPHLAGAMARPVWLLSRYDGCWRWMLDRNDSPWYPTMRIFRQTDPDDWGVVIADAAVALKELAGG